MTTGITFLLIAAVCCSILSLSSAATSALAKSKLQSRLCALDSHYCTENNAQLLKSHDEGVADAAEDDDNESDAANIAEDDDAENDSDNVHELEGAVGDAAHGIVEERSRSRITRRRSGSATKNRRNRKNNRGNRARAGRRGSGGKGGKGGKRGKGGKGKKKTIRRRKNSAKSG